MDEQLRTEFNEWARAGKGESMEHGHRPVGEQAIALMKVPAGRARAGYRMRLWLGDASAR